MFPIPNWINHLLERRDWCTSQPRDKSLVPITDWMCGDVPCPDWIHKIALPICVRVWLLLHQIKLGTQVWSLFRTIRLPPVPKVALWPLPQNWTWALLQTRHEVGACPKIDTSVWSLTHSDAQVWSLPRNGQEFSPAPNWTNEVGPCFIEEFGLSS